MKTDIPVTPDVIELGSNEKHDVVCSDAEQDRVADVVVRFVVVTVNLSTVSTSTNMIEKGEQDTKGKGHSRYSQ